MFRPLVLSEMLTKVRGCWFNWLKMCILNLNCTVWHAVWTLHCIGYKPNFVYLCTNYILFKDIVTDEMVSCYLHNANIKTYHICPLIFLPFSVFHIQPTKQWVSQPNVFKYKVITSMKNDFISTKEWRKHQFTSTL